MDDYASLSHSAWECKYHVIFIPKCRRKTLYVALRPHLGEVFRRLALQKESRIEEGHLMSDHVHMLIAIPPKYAVSQVIGFIKGRARSTWRVFTANGSGTSWASTSGRGGSTSLPWVGMRQRSETTFAGRKPKTRDWTS
jgi:putative transposase